MPIAAFSSFINGLDRDQRGRDHFIINTDRRRPAMGSLRLNLRGRIVVSAAVISGGKNESIYALSNCCCSSAAF
jgi:hypothetical protein